MIDSRGSGPERFPARARAEVHTKRETFVDKSGVIFEKHNIAGVDVPYLVGVLEQKVRCVSIPARCGALLFIGIAWLLGCPVWLVFVVTVPALWFLWRTKQVAWQPPADWIDPDGRFVKGIQMPKNVVYVPARDQTEETLKPE